MNELSGTLEGVGLPAIVRFLSALHKTGCLHITHDDWRGEVFFENGRVVDATLGSRHGLSALDALVQALPGASFRFDGDARLTGAPTIELSTDALSTHLDQIASHAGEAGPSLPSLDDVPVVVAQDEDGSGEENMPLDRGTLQTLLAVDGTRSVREIVAARGSVEALWQLANLAHLGVLRVTPPERPQSQADTPTMVGMRAPVVDRPAPTEPNAPEPQPTQPIGPAQPTPPKQPSEHVSPAAAAAAALAGVANITGTAVHCPKLGFEDDPSNAYGRATRLHRCFAAGTPLPLSLDQQRELCLTDQYPTCPRLAMAGSPEATQPTSGAPVAAAGLRRTPPRIAMQPPRPTPTEPTPATPGSDEPRIVRLPVQPRGPMPQRPSASDAPAPPEPARLRPNSISRTPAPEAEAAAPTPLRRGRTAATAAAVAPLEPAATPVVEASAPAAARAVVETAPIKTGGPLPVPVPVLAGGLAVLIGLIIVAVMIFSNLGGLLGSDDLTSLPNTSAALAGTPISALPTARPTLAAAANPAAAQAQPTPPPAVQPTLQPEPTSVPTAAQQPTTPPAQPTSPPVQPTRPPGAEAPRTLLDEDFKAAPAIWPSNQQGTAWLNGGTYRITPRVANQFVAIGAPIADLVQDVIVNATFRKVGGPAGGGYGIIVRDQGPGPRDGNNQNGNYYVLEAGDKGEVGIWRRDNDHWVDMLPWERSAAVRTAPNAANELTVRAIGQRLTLLVNGTEVGTRTDDKLSVGGVGVFVGGDGNQVSLDHLSIQTP